MTDVGGLRSSWRELLADRRVAELHRAAAGAELHLVGGAVRDAALGRPVLDLDVVVSDRGPEIAERYAVATGARLVALGGERFGALRLISGTHQIDLWDLQGGELLPDLWRRDFTVNAIALAASDGEIIDPTGGAEDLIQRRLRATRAEVFAEDPVRVLRLARLASVLPGFTAAPETVAAARAATPLLAGMPHERLRVELDLLFSRPRLAPAAGWCDDLDLPAFFFGKGASLEGATLSTLRFAERFDVLRGREPGRDRPTLPPARPEVPDNQIATHWSLLARLFSASPTESAFRIRDLNQRGLMTRVCREASFQLLAPAWKAPAKEPERRAWLHAAGAGWRDAVALRAALVESDDESGAWAAFEAAILAWPETERAWILHPPALLSGREVQELMGIEPGPAIGEALARVRKAQVDGVVRTRREAEALLGAGREHDPSEPLEAGESR